MVRRKYKPYATRKQQKNRMMRNVAFLLIVLIVAIVIFNKSYSDKNVIAAQAQDQKTPINDVLPSGGGDTEPAQEPLVVLNPAVEPAKPQPEPESLTPLNPPDAPQKQVADSELEVKQTPTSPIQKEVVIAPNDTMDATSQEAKKLIQEALNLRDANKIIAARELLNDTLNMQLSSALRTEVKVQLSKLAQSWLFSREVLDGDKLTGYYEVRTGDNLERIAKNYKVPYEILMQINGIARPELLRAGQKIKIINGPFNVVVYKNNFSMDLYLQNKYVKTYRVGLGKVEYETPNGRWRVEAGGKLIKPTWTDPDTGRTYVGDDPDYPLGSRWIALEGLDGEAKGRAGFAVHGTKEPESIGKRSSRGCIRLFNGDVVEVYNLLYAGISEVLVKD